MVYLKKEGRKKECIIVRKGRKGSSSDNERKDGKWKKLESDIWGKNVKELSQSNINEGEQGLVLDLQW